MIMVYWTWFQISNYDWEGGLVTHVLQLQDRFTPRRWQTRPYASTKCLP